EHPDGAQLGIDLHVGGVDSVRRDIGNAARGVALADFQRRGRGGRDQGGAGEGGRGAPGELHFRGGGGGAERAGPNQESGRIGLQQGAGDRQNVLLELGGSAQRGFAAKRCAA